MCVHRIKRDTPKLDLSLNQNSDEKNSEPCDYIDYDSLPNLKTSPSNLNIIQLNVRGLIGKQSSIDKLLNDRLKQCRVHVVILSETWLNESNKMNIDIPNYEYCGLTRKNKKGGGVGFLVLNSLIYRIVTNEFCYDTLEYYGIEIKCRTKNIKLSSIYRPPNTNPKQFIKEYKQLIKVPSADNSIEHIIGLDHNLDFLKSSWHLDTNDFIEANLDNGLIPCINKPTRVTHHSATLIDNIIISHRLVSNQTSKIIITDISDHLPSLVMIEGNYIEKKGKQKVRSRNLTNQNIEKIRDVLDRHDWDNILTDQTVDAGFDFWHSTLTSTIDDIAPEKVKTLNYKKSRKEPWITPGVIKCILKQKRLYKSAIKQSTELNWIKYREYKKTLDKLKRHCKISYHVNKCIEFKQNTKKLWSFINRLIGKNNDKTSIIDALIIDGKMDSDAKNITNKLCNHFSTIGESFSNQIPDNIPLTNSYINKIPTNPESLYLVPTTEQEIGKIIDSLPNKLSSGYDNVSNLLLKKLKNSILKPMYILFNKSIAEGKFPNSMKTAEVVPLLKKPPGTIPTNYRPISLLLTISKVLEKVMYVRIYAFLTKTNQLFDSQYGFRANHSCENAIQELLGNILKNLENNKYTGCIFLDLSKAFDTIKHEVLLKKLDRYGIRGVALDWFRSYLSGRKMRVKCKTSSTGQLEFSDTYPVTYGTPQGSCLGPLIFLIFTNDLHRTLLNSSCILFADDTTLYKASENLNYLRWCLEHDLGLLIDWFNSNKLTLNLDKTQLLVISNKKIPATFQLEIGNISIRPMRNVKFLGVWVDENLLWQTHVQDRAIKIRKNQNLLRKGKTILDNHSKKLIYYGHIHSHLTYGLVNWGSMLSCRDLKKLEKLQNQCVKLIEPRQSTNEIYKKYRILKFKDLIDLELAKFGFKSVHKLLPNRIISLTSTDHLGRSLIKSHDYDTRNKSITNNPPAKNNKYNKSFMNKGITIFNNLSQEIKNATSLSSFVNKFKRIKIDSYE